MAVNREARDRSVEVLAGFMRGSIDLPTARRQLDQIQDHLLHQPRDAAAIHVPLLLLDNGQKGDRIVSRDHWEFMRRYLALLRSDLDLPPAQDPESSGGPARQRLVGRVLILVLLVGLGLLPLVGWVPLAVIWAIGPIATLYAGYSPALGPGYGPFHTPEQWAQAAPLLAGLDLPPSWEDSPHYRPEDEPTWSRRAAKVAVLAVLFVLLYLILLPVWPLTAMVMALTRNQPLDVKH